MTTIRARVLVALFALICLSGLIYTAAIYWCTKRLDTPIFQDGDLAGKPDGLIAKLGEPERTFHVRADSLLTDGFFRDFFLPSDLAKLGDRRVDILIWEQRCLGSAIWRFAVVVDQESGSILAVGGESSFYSPVYFGGLIIGACGR